jgi:hypothetical protein
MVKSVPQHLWPISTVFVMVLVMTFTNTTSGLAKIVTATESKLGVTPQLKRKVTVNFPTKDKGSVFITGCDILPDGKLVFTDQEGKRCNSDEKSSFSSKRS